MKLLIGIAIGGVVSLGGLLGGMRAAAPEPDDGITAFRQVADENRRLKFAILEQQRQSVDMVGQAAELEMRIHSLLVERDAFRRLLMPPRFPGDDPSERIPSPVVPYPTKEVRP